MGSPGSNSSYEFINQPIPCGARFVVIRSFFHFIFFLFIVIVNFPNPVGRKVYMHNMHTHDTYGRPVGTRDCVFLADFGSLA